MSPCLASQKSHITQSTNGHQSRQASYVVGFCNRISRGIDRIPLIIEWHYVSSMPFRSYLFSVPVATQGQLPAPLAVGPDHQIGNLEGARETAFCLKLRTLKTIKGLQKLQNLYSDPPSSATRNNCGSPELPREINPFCTARLLDCQKLLRIQYSLYLPTYPNLIINTWFWPPAPLKSWYQNMSTGSEKMRRTLDIFQNVALAIMSVHRSCLSLNWQFSKTLHWQ